MSVYVTSFEEQRLSGVISCLQRNYQWMGDTTAKDVGNWLKPAISYSWQEDPPHNKFPYKYGILLMDDDSVVGFLGCFFSFRYWRGKKYIQLGGTAWCIDQSYRMYFIKMLRQIYSMADVAVELTPRKSVEECLLKVFHFKYVNRNTLRFFPVPYKDYSSVCKVNFFRNPAELADNILRRELIDHVKYGVRCMGFERDGEKGYIFYKKMTFQGNWLLTVKIVNGKLFADNAHELVWQLQKHECFANERNFDDFTNRTATCLHNKEWVAMECEESFLDGTKPNHPSWQSVPTVRLVLNNMSSETPPFDLMYSELVMMEYR